MNDCVKTFLEFYKIAGQLPIYVWWGGDSYQMLGLHTLPLIADCYYKGIRDCERTPFDPLALLSSFQANSVYS